MSREYTRDEVRDLFLDHVHALVDYWELENRKPSIREKLDGLAFSILCALDGVAVGLPRFRVVADPHPNDEDYYRCEGENWYPEADLDNNISGELHERFFNK